MKRKILTVTLGAATALALSVGPAAAHVNGKSGFIGPDPAANPTPHNGIECAAKFNANIGSIPSFDCPAPADRGDKGRGR